MLRAFRELTIGLFLLLAMSAGDRNVRGVVTDESKGVLPGVTVVARSPDGSVVLGTAVTDGEGRYTLGPLAPGAVMVTFQLEAFAQASVLVTIRAGADVVLNQPLAMAARSETVVVVGKVPEPPPPPPPAPPPAPRPKPVTVAVPEHDHDSVCGPAKLGAIPQALGIVRSRRYSTHGLSSAGDELVVDGGTRSGVEVGRNYAVRRTFRIGWDPHTDTGEHTAGLVQVVSAEQDTSIAVVIYACDEIMTGDRLASFLPEPVRPPAPPGVPDLRYSAKILFPDIGQLLGAPRRMMVIDQGTSDGIRVGQRMTIFRRQGRGTSVIGEAIVVAVKLDSATIRVDVVTDAIELGDRAAPQR